MGVDGEMSLEGYAEVPGALKGIGSPVLSVGYEYEDAVIVWVSSSSLIPFGVEVDEVAEKEGCGIGVMNCALTSWAGRVVSRDMLEEDDDDDGLMVPPLEAELEISPNSLTISSGETEPDPLRNVRLVKPCMTAPFLSPLFLIVGVVSIVSDPADNPSRGETIGVSCF